MDCSCSNCQNACKRKPGWFKPGEVEKVATFLGISLQELFSDYLAIDYWAGESIFILAPATKTLTGGLPGQMYTYFGKGECVFFKDGKCSIHEVKPFECKELLHDSMEISQQRHEDVAMFWKSDQSQIKELYGKNPKIERMTLKELNLMAQIWKSQQ